MTPDTGLPHQLQESLKNIVADYARSINAGGVEQAEAAVVHVLRLVGDHFERHPPEPDPLFDLIQQKEEACEWEAALALRQRVLAERELITRPAYLFKWWEHIARLHRWHWRHAEALAAARASTAQARSIPDVSLLSLMALSLEAECLLDAGQPKLALAQIDSAWALLEPSRLFDKYRAELQILRVEAFLQTENGREAESELEAVAPLVKPVLENSIAGAGALTAGRFLEATARLYAARAEDDDALEAWTEAVLFRRTWANARAPARGGALRLLALALHGLAAAHDAVGQPIEGAEARTESLAHFACLRLPPPPEIRRY
jgi:hypothetical protein